MLVAFGRENPLSLLGNASTLAMLLLLGGTWTYCRGAPRPEPRLRAIEALLMPALGALVLVMPAGAVPEPDVGGMVLFLSVSLLARCDLAGDWTRDRAQGSWVEKGRAFAAAHHADVAPSVLTLSRPRVERAS